MDPRKTYLEITNIIPEFDDFDITLEDKYYDEKRKTHLTHVYLISGNNNQSQLIEMSPTKFVHSFFPKFDADQVITKMMASKNWPNSKYHGKTREQIKASWDKGGNVATSLGTKMHETIEHFYNHETLWKEKDFDILKELFSSSSKIPYPLMKKDVNTKEFHQFLKFHTNGPASWGWIPWRTELRVFDKDIAIAGSVDMLYKSPNFTEENKLLILVDWKRSKEIKKENKFQKALKPIEDLPDCNYYQYSLQLNLYKKIIEKNTPYKIEYMALAIFHPEQKDFVFEPVNIMDKHLEKMWNQRLQELQ